MFAIGEVFLGYKTKVEVKDALVISSSELSNQLFREVWDSSQLTLRESFKAVFLNTSNRAVNFYSLSDGGVSGTVVDTRLLLQAAILSNASSIIICHNHPSGNLNPSEADRKVTKKVKEAALLFDIMLLDHIILTEDDYFSFADSGMML